MNKILQTINEYVMDNIILYNRFYFFFNSMIRLLLIFFKCKNKYY